MWVLVLIIGIFGCFGFLISALVAKIRKKKSVARNVISACVCLILSFVGSANIDSADTSAASDSIMAQSKSVNKYGKQDIEARSLKIAVKHFKSVKGLEYDTATGKLHVWVLGSENLTKKFTSYGMRMDIAKSMEDYNKISGINTLVFTVDYPLVDTYGNISEETVIKAEFSKMTLNKINFKNFDPNNIGDVASSYWEHNALK